MSHDEPEVDISVSEQILLDEAQKVERIKRTNDQIFEMYKKREEELETREKNR